MKRVREGFIIAACLLASLVFAIMFLSPTPATVAPTPSPVPDRAAAEYIDPRLLASDPKAHVGRNVILIGEALTVDQKRDGSDPYTWVQLMAAVRDRTTTESIVVEIRPLRADVLRQECYRIFGVVVGTQRVTRTLTGATNDAPQVNAYAVEGVAKDKSLGCPKP